MSEPVTYPIGVVSSLTGLSTHVLRAWERRHRAVTPQRSASGRRLYLKDDIDRLILLKGIVKGGHSISHVANLETARLAELAAVGCSKPMAANAPIHAKPDNPKSGYRQPIDDCLQAVGELDGWRLQRILMHIADDCNRQILLDEIIRPFMTEVGRRWSDGAFRIVHGQLASVVVHTLLAGMLESPDDVKVDGPCMLIATPAGQRCYLGALAAAVTAQDYGWMPVFVGYDLPDEEIAAAQARVAPQITALSITCQLDAGDPGDVVERLAVTLNPSSALIVGGRAIQPYKERIEAVGATLCFTTADLAHRIT